MLLRFRIPSLVVGLALGLVLFFIMSRFEEVLAQSIAVAFFIPFIVYLAAAVGAQTQNIYARDLRTSKASFKKYFVKETALGIILGLLFALVVEPIVLWWFHLPALALAISLSTFGAVASAPLIALLVTEILELQKMDQAVGAGPLATVIQDMTSVVIYDPIASAILL